MQPTNHANQIQALALRLDRLLETTQKLAAENKALKQQFDQLSNERTLLQGKNELARTRVQSMLGRLNELERDDE
ncbi:MAG: TIGR02449 family protein [Arenimonas sp.]|nr:TIGR02449 family protein [Arenimonas sp.]